MQAMQSDACGSLAALVVMIALRTLRYYLAARVSWPKDPETTCEGSTHATIKCSPVTLPPRTNWNGMNPISREINDSLLSYW